VDLGGGRGALVNAVMSVNDNIEVVIFDQPHVVKAASEDVPHDPKRVKFVGGDFFQSVPEGGDVYTMKWILHDWDDKKSGLILDSIHRSIEKSPHSRLLLFEMIVQPIGTNSGEFVDFAALLDTNMMVVAGGKERTEEEFQILVGKHGFRFLRATNIHPFLNIIESELA